MPSLREKILAALAEMDGACLDVPAERDRVADHLVEVLAPTTDAWFHARSVYQVKAGRHEPPLTVPDDS